MRQTWRFAFFAIAQKRGIGEKNAIFSAKMDHTAMSDTLWADSQTHEGCHRIPAGFLDRLACCWHNASASARAVSGSKKLRGAGSSSARSARSGCFISAKLWKVARFGCFQSRRPPIRHRCAGGISSPAVVVGFDCREIHWRSSLHPWVVCFSLIVGGAILMGRSARPKPHEHDATKFPLLT